MRHTGGYPLGLLIGLTKNVLESQTPQKHPYLSCYRLRISEQCRNYTFAAAEVVGKFGRDLRFAICNLRLKKAHRRLDKLPIAIGSCKY
jgi:hypothetical protein